MISLPLTIRNLLDRLVGEISEDMPDCMFDDYLMVFPVLHAIARGGTRIVEEIYSGEGLVTSPAESDAVRCALGVIQEIDRKVAIMDTLIRWSSDLDEPASEKIHLLREQSGGSDDLIAEVAGNPGFGLPIRIVEELLSGISVSIENDDKCQIGQEYVQLKSLTSSVKDFLSSIKAMYSLTNRSLIVRVCEISRGVMRP